MEQALKKCLQFQKNSKTCLREREVLAVVGTLADVARVDLEHDQDLGAFRMERQVRLKE